MEVGRGFAHTGNRGKMILRDDSRAPKGPEIGGIVANWSISPGRGMALQ